MQCRPTFKLGGKIIFSIVEFSNVVFYSFRTERSEWLNLKKLHLWMYVLKYSEDIKLKLFNIFASIPAEAKYPQDKYPQNNEQNFCKLPHV